LHKTEGIYATLIMTSQLREISDEDVVKILGHRAPGEEYPSVHPPLEERDEPEDAVRD
jgi:methyl-coenzyme M reductase gamma subunit